ncbi:MAG: hypothetical protein RLZZ226_321 [Pseudomonadota bacterium]
MFAPLKNLALGLFSRLELSMVDVFGLERMKEAFRRGVVPTIPLAAHATDKLACGEDFLIYRDTTHHPLQVHRV